MHEQAGLKPLAPDQVTCMSVVQTLTTSLHLLVTLQVRASLQTTHQPLLQPEGVGQVFPLLVADDEAQPVEQRDGDGRIVQLEELGSHGWVRRPQAQQKHSLHLVKDLAAERLSLKEKLTVIPEPGCYW